MALARVMSSAIALWLALSLPLAAHEVFPSILNLRADDGQIVMELDFSAEAIMAGIDLDGVEDTDAAENATDYDALRALDVQALADMWAGYYSTFAPNFTVLADGEPVALNNVSIIVNDEIDPELARISTVTLSGDYAGDAETFQIGWAREYGTLVVRQNAIANAPFTGTVSEGDLTQPFLINGGTVLSGWQVFLDYIPAGFDHIIPLGLDHILFVLGLFFLAATVRPLLWQVTMFTLAHTVTLALGALGVVNIPGSIVEPLIAASIVYVAVENVFTEGLNKWRPAIIFGFGLLHGLGFASVLGDYGLPEAAFIPALIGFNIGVEGGQLTVIAVAFLVSYAALRASRVAGMETMVVYGYILLALIFGALSILELPEFLNVYLVPFLLPLLVLSLLCAVCTAASSVGTAAYRQFVSIPASLTIAAVGIYWVIERVFF